MKSICYPMGIIGKKNGRKTFAKILIMVFVAFTMYSQQAVSQCLTVSSCIESDFNDNAIPAGKYIWFTSTLRLKSNTTYPITFTFASQTITSSAFTINVPAGKVTLTNAVTTATTVY